ncbi:MAG TPA: Stp1/IreP family PP2C-type Ser/Thr phosphatase [Rhabdochlamydiaceae bacterium]|nr:Stp1/IreP family PP2C-type Ser/Thr phosphatase [Rhabdochlamydiaceae bacterium]
MPFHVDSFGCSDIGLVRKNNEDIWMSVPEKNFYLLSDGMGGHNAGEIAAREAAESVCSSIENMDLGLSLEDACRYIKDAIISANQHVYKLASTHDAWHGMGTTLCCFFLHEQTLIYAHVGDSRIYRFRGKLERMTQDHSLRQEIINRLQLKKNLASHLPFKNVITRAIGTYPKVEPEMATTAVHLHDIYFLCSDGLTDMVSDEEIEEILQNASSLEEACDTMVESAKCNGGNDNITILMIKIGPR